MKQLLTILFFTIVIIGCKKTEDDTYTITGLVLDWDARTPIAGAKVYVNKQQGFFSAPIDSAISDANGRVSFTYVKGDDNRSIFGHKNGYLIPFAFTANPSQPSVSRTQEIYLARPSNLTINLHKTNSYLASDTFHLHVDQYYILGNGVNLARLANSADTVITLYFVCHSFATKVYPNWRVSRNGTNISSNSDSTALIQFGTKNYNLNY